MVSVERKTNGGILLKKVVGSTLIAAGLSVAVYAGVGLREVRVQKENILKQIPMSPQERINVANGQIKYLDEVSSVKGFAAMLGGLIFIVTGFSLVTDRLKRKGQF